MPAVFPFTPVRGFSFFELLIVLVILSALSILIMSQVTQTGESSTLDNVARQIRQLSDAVKQYKTINDDLSTLSIDVLIERGYIPNAMLNDSGKISNGIFDNSISHAYLLSVDQKSVVVTLRSGSSPMSVQQLRKLDQLIAVGLACDDNGVGIYQNCGTSSPRAVGSLYWHRQF